VQDDRRFVLALRVDDTCAEGPGRRTALWVQGCPFRCPGCCNPQMQAFTGGTWVDVDDEIERLAALDVDGITLLGGEPFAHAPALARLARGVRAQGKTVMAFSGYTLAQLQGDIVVGAAALLQACDLLVDGLYVQSQPETERRWIGSRNQRMHFLSSAYDPADPCFTQRNTVELRLRGDGVVVNGWPTPDGPMGRR